MITELFTALIIFSAALFFLVKSADYFVRYSEKTGLSLGIPQFIIGVTVVSMGTSLPELATSLFSIFKGEPGIVAANVIGSNVANILLVIGVTTIIIRKIEIKRSLIRIDLPLLVGSGAILVLTMMDGKFTFTEAIFCLLGFIVYVLYNYYDHKETTTEKEEVILEKLKLKKRPPFKWGYLLGLLISGVVLYFSAEYTIEGVIMLGGILKLDTSIIAITAIAIGTSLPELLVCITSARKGNFDIALGNILGSNIFNGFLIMGVSGVVSELPIDASVLTIGLPFFIIATIFLAFSGIERKFYNFEGALFIILYLLFIGQLFQFI